MTPLYQELHRWASTPFIWGETDCMLCICDWVKRVRGVDPGESIRGTYDSRGSCHRETGFFRDPVGVVNKFFSACGLVRSKGAEKGDVALIMVREPDGRVTPCGAVWLGDSWGCKGPSGTTTIKPDGVPVLAIWSVEYEA